MPKLPVIKAKDLIRVLNKLGFFKHHQVGSHIQFKNADGLRITVPVHSRKDLKRKILKGIIADLEITVEKFIDLFKK